MSEEETTRERLAEIDAETSIRERIWQAIHEYAEVCEDVNEDGSPSKERTRSALKVDAMLDVYRAHMKAVKR